jgi:hypothetical protein
MPPYPRKDGNHAELERQIRQLGASTLDLSGVGRSAPDLLVGWRGHNILLEIKTDKGKLSKGQITWHDEWRGNVYVVRTFEDVLHILEAYQ